MSWYYISGGKKVGPVTEAEVRLQMSSGAIEPTAMVKIPWVKEWIFARDVSEHFSDVSGTAPMPGHTDTVPVQAQVDVRSFIIVLRSWYSNLSNKRRLIALGIAIALSAIPLVGWIFIAPWLIPLMIYLEWQRP